MIIRFLALGTWKGRRLDWTRRLATVGFQWLPGDPKDCRHRTRLCLRSQTGPPSNTLTS